MSKVMVLLFALFFIQCPLFAYGEFVRIFPDQRALSGILTALDSAQTSVDMIQFSFAIDTGGKIDRNLASFKIARKLIELKKTRGRDFRIRLYIESSRYTASRNRITAEYLAKNGVDVVYGASHAKAIIIDGKSVWFGSTNLTTQSLSHNNETNVLIQDLPKLTQAFSAYFEKLWNSGARVPTIHPPQMPESGLQLYTDAAYKTLLLNLIRGATKTLDFSIYYFSEPEIEKALIEAKERGVAVRGYINQHKSFGLELVKRN